MRFFLLLCFFLPCFQAINLGLKVLEVCTTGTCVSQQASCVSGDIVNVTQVDSTHVVMCADFRHIKYTDVGRTFRIRFSDNTCSWENMSPADVVFLGSHTLQFTVLGVCFDNEVVGGCQNIHEPCPERHTVFHLQRDDITLLELCVQAAGFGTQDVGVKYDFSLRYKNCLRYKRTLPPHEVIDEDY
nr:NS7a protein [Rousettus bat coronavirus]